jgi:TolA-binding protein
MNRSPGISLILCLGILSLRSIHAAEGAGGPEELFKEGATAYQAGDFKTASEDFNQVLALNPEGEALETILYSLASAYQGMKEFPKAEEYFNRYLKEFPQGKNAQKVLIAISQIQIQTGRKAEAEKTLRRASEGTGELATRARLSQASLLSDTGHPEDAVAVLKPLVSGGIKNDLSVQAAMQLAQIEAAQGDLDSSLKLLEQLRNAGDLVDNPLQLDFLSVKIGDALLEKGERRKALRMYALVRPRDTVAALQKERIAAIEKKIAANKASLQTNPKALIEVNAANTRLQNQVVDLRKVLDQFEKMPDTTVPVRIRQAKAYEEMDGQWETILIWESLADASDSKTKEDALFSIGSAYYSLARPDDAVPALDRYLAAFPNGKYAGQAQYLKGAVYLAANDYPKAETVFGTLISKGDGSPLAGEMLFLLANSQFAQASDPEKRDKYKEAADNYRKYMDQYPSGNFAEECLYRIPLSSFMAGDYGKALEGFREYARKYPKGTFAGDVDYRIALCYNAAQKYDEVLKLCTDWRSNHAGENMEAEVMALEGDAYAAKSMPAESAAAYRKSVELGETQELIRYSLAEANKQYQQIGRWDEISDMFGGYAARYPDEPMAVAAAYWVSKAKLREGKGDEAKAFLAETALRNIDNRRKDAVEQLLTLLAQTCSKRPKKPLIAPEVPAASPSPSPVAEVSGGDAAPAATPTASPTPLAPYDAEAEFAKYLDDSKAGSSLLAKARLRYATAQLAGFTKKPERKKEIMLSVCRDYPASVMSAPLLAECGEITLAKGDADKASSFYKELLEAFPKSDLREYAYCGLGEVALERNKPDEALRWFDDAVEKGAADSTLGRVTFGKGMALLALGKPDEAAKIFTQVAGTKEWRGELTAKSLLAMGDLEDKRGRPAEATQYYQRVFVAYQRYPDIMAEAYLRAAADFVKLGKPDFAAAHLREMLANPKLSQHPRAEEARKKLEELPATAPSATPKP